MNTATRLRSLLIGGLVCFNILVFILSGYSLQHSRQQYELRAEVLTQNITNALDQNLSNSIEKVDLALHAVADELERQLADKGINEVAMNDFLMRQEERLKEIEAFRVANANGQVILGKGLDKNQPQSWADRDYFSYHRDHAERSLQVAKPRMGRLAKQYIVGFSRRYNYPDGRFAGVISAPIAVSHFTGLLAKFDLGKHGSIILRDCDLGLITRVPALADQDVGQTGNSTVSTEFRELIKSGITSASFHTSASSDGQERIVSYRQLRNVPMIAISGTASEDYLAGWWQEVTKTLAMVSGFLALSLLLGVSLSRQLIRSEKNQQALIKREAQLQTLIRTVPDSIQFKDGAGRWLVANNVCQELFGLADKAWHGLTDAQIAVLQPVMAEALAACQAGDEAAWQAGGPRRSEESFNDIRGQTAQFETIKVPLFDDNGQRQAMVVVSRDISERKRNENELAHYRAHLEELVQRRTFALLDTEARASHILASSADGLYGVDNDGLITFINPAACNMLGYEAEALIGRPAHASFHHSKPDGSVYPLEECPSQHALHSGQKVRIDNEVYWHADGHPIPVMYGVHPMIQNEVNLGAVVSFVDMTAQHAASRAREQALNAAENLARIRSEFLANMSHEIRTPLNGVLGFAEIGFRNYQNSERARDAFAKIQTSGQRLLGVINDILDFSKIEAGKLRIEQTDVSLHEVIDHAIELVGDRAQAKGLNLHLEYPADVPGHCISDPLRIGQVLLNLLTNAVKFTETGSVTLNLSLSDAQLIFKISDTGIGIQEEQLTHLFNPFHQADTSATRRFGGTGLGLAICKRIVELMGGSIVLASTEGRGTTVTFSIPYVPQTQATPPTINKPVPATKALMDISILLAEDDPVNRALIIENLSREGARVLATSNGREALERLIEDGRTAYDLVLMDIQMPEMDGYEATRRIAELAPDLPVIAHSAHVLPEEREKCLAAGMLDHIGKPINRQEMLAVILTHLPKQKARAGS